MKKIHEKSRETYGARRIRQDLMEDGESVSRTRAGRLMKQQGLESKSRRKFKATTNSNHGRPVAPKMDGLPGNHSEPFGFVVKNDYKLFRRGRERSCKIGRAEHYRDDVLYSDLPGSWIC